MAAADVADQGDVPRGTNSGCDAALRPRGSARVARAGGAQGATKWQGGHAATWAPVGRHV